MAERNSILEKLEGLGNRFKEISTLITDPSVIADQTRYIKLSKEYKELEEIMQARKLIAQGGEITVDGDLVTIPVVKKGTVTNESFRLPDVEYTKFDAEENEFTISLPAAHHVIRGAFFESSDAFDAFKSTFK